MSFLSREQIESWERDGYLVLPELLNKDEVSAVRERFDRLGEDGQPIPGYWEPDTESISPLARYPRVMHPHRFCKFSKSIMLKRTVGNALADLFGEEPVACQSMFYYKPPDAAGQALHQDNFYLAIQPGTCIAAWTAIDPATQDNGCLYVVPGSHKLDVICPDPQRFTEDRRTNLVDPPKGMKAVAVLLNPGDTLFFNGSVIHGSGRNRSKTQWRRSFICHYMPASSTQVNASYQPIHNFDGQVVQYDSADNGGPCGDAIGHYGNTYGVDALIH